MKAVWWASRCSDWPLCEKPVIEVRHLIQSLSSFIRLPLISYALNFTRTFVLAGPWSQDVLSSCQGWIRVLRTKETASYGSLPANWATALPATPSVLPTTQGLRWIEWCGEHWKVNFTGNSLRLGKSKAHVILTHCWMMLNFINFILKLCCMLASWPQSFPGLKELYNVTCIGMLWERVGWTK